MMRSHFIAGMAIASAGLLYGRGASAGEVLIGGGITQFTDRAVRDTVSPVGGLWSLRAGIGENFPVGLEVGYIGTADQIRSLFGPRTAALFGTTFETDVRLNTMPGYELDPYAFIGIGWTHYSVNDGAFSLASAGISSHDDLLEMPVGAGLAYRIGDIIADLRATYRGTTDSNLIVSIDSPSRQYASMHTWDATLALGYEF